MGQEISLEQFDEKNFERFYQKLKQETHLLSQLIEQNACSTHQPVAGFEIEAWLVDDNMRPSPTNENYLATFNHPWASAELAKFNIEFNSTPTPLTDDVFSRLHEQLQTTWMAACQHAETLDSEVVMIGILPTLKQSDLNLSNMSNMNRYRALNEQVLHARGRPIHIDINGAEHLKFDHDDVMIESATTSFQLHIQLPLSIAHHFYNASIIASAPVVALCANAPFLFGKELWHESRIPLFEQSVESGGYSGASHGPIKRVSFGSDYARRSIIECFQENLDHFPVLLPVEQDSAIEAFAHLRLHNGTIWRWNRPLVGFDGDGTPHIRVEHRTPASGPSVIDSIANAAFYYGLTQSICDEIVTKGWPLPFAQARDNFYKAARFGLDSHIIWFDGYNQRLSHLFQTELLPRAMSGLESLGICRTDIDTYLDIIRQRIAHRQNGSQWQRRYIYEHDHDFTEMMRNYLKNQNGGNPVGTWDLA
ncbi:glutamate--cysteine ligase [Methylobacter sp. YRD-M1]|uniref:glutamate--cysteine ligase n=1 Tax=Methylobacter sp. YRD-M1 TaxID=2911520 RepID=UPI00227B1383|nr:glutamate--cysteine ligase [Methylobacter sp. YRD-M1]WAK00617.1 glutamate--cysteine ligase [Methylobacter sp. YRD-M1]